MEKRRGATRLELGLGTQSALRLSTQQVKNQKNPMPRDTFSTKVSREALVLGESGIAPGAHLGFRLSAIASPPPTAMVPDVAPSGFSGKRKF